MQMRGVIVEPAGAATPVLGGDRLPDQALDVVQLVPLVRIAKRNGRACGAGARGASDAVHIVLWYIRQLVIHHVCHLRNVNATCSNIGCNQHPDPRCAEGSQRMLALRLALVAVDRGDPDAGGLEMTGNPICATLGPREHKRTRDLRVGKQLHEQGALLVAFCVDHAMRDAVDECCRGGGRNPGGVAQQIVGQPADLRRHGRREEEALALRGKLRNDATDRGQEAEIQHLIGFVEHQHLRARERDVALSDVIDEPARRGNQNVKAARQCLGLRCVPHAAVHYCDGGAEMLPIDAEALSDLARKFASGGENQDAAALARRLPPIGRQPVDDRQREGCSLACPRLSDAKSVAAGKNDGYLPELPSAYGSPRCAGL